MPKWIQFPRIEGVASRQAHADLPPGTYEREIGREGFYGPATHMYHRHPPTAWTSFSGPLRPRAFDANRLDRCQASPWDATPLLSNAHVRVRWWRSEEPMPHLARNADGDELLFVHAGGGELYCDYGHLTLACALGIFSMFHFIVRQPVFWFAIAICLAAAEGFCRVSVDQNRSRT